METTKDEISGTSPESVKDGDRTQTDSGRVRQLANIENEPPLDGDGKTKRKGAKRSLESSGEYWSFVDSTYVQILCIHIL